MEVRRIPASRYWQWAEAFGRYTEAALVAIASPALVFPNRFTAYVLPLFPLLWLLRWKLTGRLTRRTPMDKPVLLLMLMLMVSLYPSIDLASSMPKYLGVLLGIVLFYAVVNTVRTRGQALALGWMLLLLGGLIALAALLGTSWMGGKFGLDTLAQQLPRAFTSVEGSQRTLAGFHPNEVGGALVLFLPLSLALAAGNPRLRLAGVGLALLVSGTLLLTQSRSAFMGVGAGLLFLATVRWRRLVYAWAALPVAIALLLFTAGPDRLAGWLLPAQSQSAVGIWESRVEVWERAWYMVQDFPYTGVGLNTFPKVVDLLYPLFFAPDASAVTHAHNFFLQTAVDLGVPGLLAFLWILGAFYLSLREAWRRHGNDGQVRALAAGLAAGMLAHLVFGLTDAMTLGAKPGAALWLMLGLGAALANLPRRPLTSPEKISFCPGPGPGVRVRLQGTPEHDVGTARGART